MTSPRRHIDILRLAASSLDFDLDPGERRQLDEHLDACEACRLDVARLRVDASILRRRERPLPPTRLASNVAALELQMPLARLGPSFGGAWLVAALLLGIAMVAMLAFAGARPRPNAVTVAPSVSAAAHPIGAVPIAGDVVRTYDVGIGHAADGHSCAQLPLSDCAPAIAAVDGAIWVTTTDGLVRIDPAAGPGAAIPLPAFPRAIAFAADAVWVAVAGDRSIVAFDQLGQREIARISLDAVPTAMVTDEAGLWVATDRSVVRIDPIAGTVMGSTRLPGAATSIAAVDGSLVVALPGQQALAIIDERSLQPRVLDVEANEPTAVAAGVGSVWFAGHDEAAGIDLAGPAIGPQVFAPTSSDLAIVPTATGPTIWLVSTAAHTIRVVDGILGGVVAAMPIAGSASDASLAPLAPTDWRAAATWDGHAVWVRLYEPAMVLEISPRQLTP